ncbi:MAG TPA: exodeoxyribonuclease III [Bellilinea sp.]|mgnify:CR=1 FL=1|nr:exodeoxyribonuclease III [Bellilinea sp.]
MKITTWNVNGFRAVLKKGFREWFEQDNSDIYCFQEVKSRFEQVDEPNREWDGYRIYWNAAQRPGYSGVATFSKHLPIEITYGLNDDRFDNEGRVIRTRYHDFEIFNIYFPNGQRGQDRVDFKLNFYSHLLDICLELQAKGIPVILTGDFNTAHQEIDLARPKENQTTSGFLPEEREWVTRYLESNFHDVFRKLYPDKVEYTWWNYITSARSRNVGWRLDYFLVTPDLLDRVEDVVIQGDVFGSDHCPVSLILRQCA